MRAAFIYFILSAFLTSAAADDWTLRVQFASSVWQNTLIKCPEKIWPGLDWSNTGMLLVSRELKRAAFITAAKNPETLRITSVPKDSVSVEDFKIISFRGKTVAVINYDKQVSADVSSPSVLAVHELFHKIGQVGWKLTATRRGDLFPFLAQPRIDRGMVMFEMQKYSEGDGFALPRAAYWYSKWKADAPDEISFATDTREGTARYVEIIAIEYARAGCEGNIEPFTLAEIRSLAPNDLHGLDGEGYALGSTAGFLLDKLKPDWKATVKFGPSPLELLFNGVQLQSGPEDFDLHLSISDRMDQANNEVGQIVKPVEDWLMDPDIFRVVIPETWSPDNVGLMATLIPRQAPNRSYLLFPYGQEFHSGKGGWMILTNTTAGVLRPDEPAPCPRRGVEFLVPKTKISTQGTRYSAHTAYLDFDFVAQPVARGGLFYLCPVTN